MYVRVYHHLIKTHLLGAGAGSAAAAHTSGALTRAHMHKPRRVALNNNAYERAVSARALASTYRTRNHEARSGEEMRVMCNINAL